MNRRGILAAVGTAALLLGGCSSDTTEACSLSGATELALTTWPRFHADLANSGRAAIDLSVNSGNGRLLFPLAGQVIGPTETTPILGPEIIYLGSADTNVYALDYDGIPAPLEADIQAIGAVTGSPLLGVDGTLFVPTAGALSQFRANGTPKNSAGLPGFDAASPNIWIDGTVFVGTLSGGLSRVCPNGVSSYQLMFPTTQSPVGIAQDPEVPNQSAPIIVAAGLAGIVRAYNRRGRQRWSFFASATVNAGVVIDGSADLFYVADINGRMFAGALSDGSVVSSFEFGAEAGIAATPALGRDTAPVPTIYVADLGGTVYALDRATGAVRWTFQAAGPISSSPAVGTGGEDDIIVFGADVLGSLPGSSVMVPIDGRVYALRDDGSQGTLLWTYEVGSSVGASSPSIGSDGTVYMGRQGQQLGDGSQCPGGAGTCTVNIGGGLIAIGPSA
jgi:outer membrane protein assembly factor BamB